MSMQTYLNELNQQWQKERAETQLTLGQLIKILETLPDETEIENLGELDSYRGYYSDLAFEPVPGKRPVSEVLADCYAAMGEIFIGYKGGKFLMGAATPLWYAHYGHCGKKLMGVSIDGSIITAEDDTI